MAFIQGQKFWIERAIEDAKSSAELTERQVRNWNGRHHHMTLAMLALFLMLQIKIKYKNTKAHVSC